MRKLTAYLTRCLSAVAELLVVFIVPCAEAYWLTSRFYNNTVVWWSKDI